MTQGWVHKKLKDCFKLKSGDGLTAKQMVEGVYPVFGGNGQAGMHNQYNLSGDNVIIGRVGALCGNAKHIRESIWLTDNAFKVIDKKFQFDNKFLTYLLSYMNLRSFARQAAQPVISNSSLSELELAFPMGIEEQKRIVAILDQAFADIDKARALTEQSLKNARELFESYLQQVFSQRGEGWTEKALSDLGLVQTGNTPKTSEKDNFGGFIPFVKPGHFLENGEIETKENGLSEKGKSLSRVISKNSVLMVCIGATIGKCGYIEEEVTCNQQINSLTPTGEVHHRFAYYQMLTPRFQSAVIKLSGQATLPIINKKKWSSLTLSFPHISEQLKFIESLDRLKSETMALEKLYQDKLLKLDVLKASILQKAFTGELTKDHKEAAA